MLRSAANNGVLSASHSGRLTPVFSRQSLYEAPPRGNRKAAQKPHCERRTGGTGLIYEDAAVTLVFTCRHQPARGPARLRHFPECWSLNDLLRLKTFDFSSLFFFFFWPERPKKSETSRRFEAAMPHQRAGPLANACVSVSSKQGVTGAVNHSKCLSAVLHLRVLLWLACCQNPINGGVLLTDSFAPPRSSTSTLNTDIPLLKTKY